MRRVWRTTLTSWGVWACIPWAPYPIIALFVVVVYLM